MIIGHEKQLNFLKRMADSGKIPHALLFTGQEKLGKKTVALQFISSLLGENPENHPDFILISSPKQDLKVKQIQINQIRDLSWRLSLKPIKSSLKAAIVDGAHLMTREAQNCFLKTLEEPKGNAILILITEHPNFLLPTIVSRCETFKFYSVTEKILKKFLVKKNIPEEKHEKILNNSFGKPGLMMDFLEDPGKLKMREEKIKEVVKVLKLPFGNRFQYAKELADKENIIEVLEIWTDYFRSVLLKKCLNFDFESLEKVKNFLENIQKTNFLLSTTNINSKLALEILMMQI